MEAIDLIFSKVQPLIREFNYE